MNSRWPWLRDIALFVMGAGGVAHETLSKAERPTLLVLFAAMMGLPAFLKPGSGGRNGGPPDPPPGDGKDSR